MNWAPTIGWGLAGLGTLGSIAATQDYAKSQRQMIEQQQANERVGLVLRGQDRVRRRNQVIGEQAARFGASGVTMDGTVGDVLADTASEFAREDFNDNYNSQAKQQAWDLSKSAIERNANLKSVASLFNFGANALLRG